VSVNKNWHLLWEKILQRIRRSIKKYGWNWSGRTFASLLCTTVIFLCFLSSRLLYRDLTDSLILWDDHLASFALNSRVVWVTFVLGACEMYGVPAAMQDLLTFF